MSAVLLSIKSKWADLILSGKKTVEWRKTFPNSKDWGNLVLMYSTKPEGRISGVARVSHILPVDSLSGKLSSGYSSTQIITTDCLTGKSELGYSINDLIANGCVPEDDLKKYSGGKRLYAWIIDWAIPVPDNTFPGIIGNRGPQSWQYIDFPEDENLLKNFIKPFGKTKDDMI